MASPRLIAGLDFGSFSVKAVWVERKGSAIRIVRSAELLIPPETQDVTRFVSPWIEKNSLRNVNCAVALPGPQSVFQPVFLSSSDPRSVMQAAEMEVSSFNSMSGETMFFDASAGETCDDGRRGILMALSRPTSVTRVIREAESYGVRILSLPPAPVAVFNGITNIIKTSEDPMMFVNIGHLSTDIAVSKSGKLVFARSFSGGGRLFTEALMKLRGITAVQADALKQSEGCLDSSTDIGAAMLSVASEWINRFNSARAVYRGIFRESSNSISSIKLSGGGALLTGFAEYISKKIEIPVSVVSQEKEITSQFVLALGLALAGAESACCKTSLLPEWMRNEAVFREKKPYWIAAGICASLTILVFIVSGIRAIARERAAVELESKRIAELRSIDSSIRALRAESSVIRDFSPEILKMLQAGPLARELVALVAESIDPNDWIAMICDEAAYLPPELPSSKSKIKKVPRELKALPLVTSINAPSQSLPAKSPQPDSQNFATFIIEGYTPMPDLVSVKRLIGKLKASSLVKRADVLGDELVLPTALSADVGYSDAQTSSLTKFVVSVEVNRP